jgi:hypothetical protein
MWIEGKKIICIKSHSQGIFKEGEIFTLRGVYKNICKCSILKLDIGFKTDRFIGLCPLCNERNIQEHGNAWLFNETLFKPLDEDFAEEICSNFEKEFKENKITILN